MRILTRTSLLAAMLAIAVALAACGGSHTSVTTTPTVLNSAISADPSPLDPDTYYEAEGLPMTTAMYEGLLTYAPNSPKIVGLLATKWQESKDGLTYTFTLRSGVTFSDGTPFDAAAAKASFQRRIDLKAGPSYMLANVKSMATKGTDTFIVHLSKPTSPFLDYLSSPYGPVMTSPTAVAAHAKGKDHASKWLATHSAGTGPYVFGKVVRGSLYQFTANPTYWGTKAFYKTINFNVIPDFETQRLKLEGGQLDFVFSRLSTRDLQAVAQNPKLQVQSFPALLKTAIWVNPTSSVFGPPAMRAALRAGVDNTTMTSVLGKWGTVSTDVYPKGMLPDGAAPDKPAYQPDQLKAALASHKGGKVVIGYYGSANMAVLASRLQVQLQALGLNATTREYQPAVLFTLPTNPKLRPDLMVTTFNPDANAPDTFARIYWYKNAPVNLLGCTAATGDKLLDRAAAEPDPAKAVALNVQAAEAYRASNCWINTSDVQDTIAARKGITGFVHELPWVFSIRLASLKEG